MRSKILLKKPLLITSFLGIVFALFLILFLNIDIPYQISYAKNSPIKIQTLQPLTGTSSVQLIQNISSSGKQINFGIPIRLTIPKIKVDATIKSLGLTSNGNMDTAKGPYDVGWFNLGPRPGEIGSAVIAGHYGRWKTGEGSVFDKLHTLGSGDKIYVKDDKGITVTFIVRETKIYDPSADASYVFISHDGKSHLNLITCEGARDKVAKAYSRRLVVFTDKS